MLLLLGNQDGDVGVFLAELAGEAKAGKAPARDDDVVGRLGHGEWITCPRVVPAAAGSGRLDVPARARCAAPAGTGRHPRPRVCRVQQRLPAWPRVVSVEPRSLGRAFWP